MTKLEEEFTAALLGLLDQAEALTGIGEPRLRASAERLGGARAFGEMLRRGKMTRQFQRLKELKRLDLSPESLAVQGRFSDLFSDEEANLCLQTLLEAGGFDTVHGTKGEAGPG